MILVLEPAKLNDSKVEAMRPEFQRRLAEFEANRGRKATDPERSAIMLQMLNPDVDQSCHAST